ncbi:Na+/H+ antiporter subunit E [Akkermansiaceae bacterium]|nr:Na+/H+ antiporter subunit E [Akkermansiaceae bacterium]
MKRQRLPFALRAWGWISFAGFYLAEVLRSNMVIVWDVLTVEDKTCPSIIALDLPSEMTDNQVLLVSNLMTMTPGSLTLDLTADRAKLLVHVLYSHDVEDTRSYLMKNYVHRVLDLS